jgi:hypothetical protein
LAVGDVEGENCSIGTNPVDVRLKFNGLKYKWKIFKIFGLMAKNQRASKVTGLNPSTCKNIN